jgi:hypothetical protein
MNMTILVSRFNGISLWHNSTMIADAMSVDMALAISALYPNSKLFVVYQA